MEGAKIVVLKKSGQDGPEMKVMPEEEYTIGRAEDADIRIKLETVSNLHAKLVSDKLGQAPPTGPLGRLTGRADVDSPPEQDQRLHSGQWQARPAQGGAQARRLLLDRPSAVPLRMCAAIGQQPRAHQ